MQTERRQRRSEQGATALRYQLEHTRERGGLAALVLSDIQGLVVAASGEYDVCEELGAIAPLVGRSLFRPKSSLLGGASFTVHRIQIEGQELFLSALGGGIARDACITTSIGGVERILASN